MVRTTLAHPDLRLDPRGAPTAGVQPGLHHEVLLASRLNGEAAYFYTNMVSATTFIETISPTSLSIDPQEFISHMKAAGVPGSEDRPRRDQASASAAAAEQAPVDQAPAEQARPPQDLPTPPQHQEEQQQQAFKLLAAQPSASPRRPSPPWRRGERHAAGGRGARGASHEAPVAVYLDFGFEVERRRRPAVRV